MKSSNDKVNDFLIDIKSTLPERYEIVEEIRAVFLSGKTEIKEDIKYGGIVFNVSGELVGGVFLYKQHLSIEFSNGTQFDDPEKLLEGKGNMRRHLKILEKDELITKNISFYINQASKENIM